MTAREAFYEWGGPRRTATVGQVSVELPLFYRDNEVFMSLHTASYQAVAAELPGEVIRPTRWVSGRAVLGVIAFRYRAVTWAGGDGSTGSLSPYRGDRRSGLGQP
jgi:hypothetical protein